MSSTKIYGICKLCGKNSLLMKSHIIPKFIGKMIKDTEKKIYYIQKDKLTIKQDLDKLHLLCMECECKLSKFENHASTILKYPIKLTDINDNLICRVNYHLFKLFYLSIIWRFYISDDLDPSSHAENMRNMLNNDDAGSDIVYPLYLSSIKELSPLFPVEGSSRSLMVYPWQLYFHNADSIALFMAGYFWIIILESNDSIEKIIHFRSLKENNHLVIYKKLDPLQFEKFIFDRFSFLKSKSPV